MAVPAETRPTVTLVTSDLNGPCPGPSAPTLTGLTGNSTTDTLTVTVTQLTYLLAEGSTGSFFDLDVLIANPNAQAAPVVVTFFKEDGTTITQNLNLAATSR
jgi:hypothetical protein